MLAGRISRILIPEASSDGIVIIENFIVSDENDARLNMPILTSPKNSKSRIESISIVNPKVSVMIVTPGDVSRLLLTTILEYRCGPRVAEHDS